MELRPFTVDPKMLEAKRDLESRFLPKEPLGIAAFTEAIEKKKRLGSENIVGVGIGEKHKFGQPTGQLCLKVYVVRKLTPEMVSESTLVEPEFKGFRTDVEEVGEVVAYQVRSKLRPAPAGVSVSHYKVTAGTLGCLVRSDDNIYIMSNNHVLADSNRGSRGDPILQPGNADGGQVSSDQVATLDNFVWLNFSGGVNYADVAIARPSDDWWNQVAPFILQVGEVRGIRNPILDLRVKKMGRTTFLTQGKIDGVDVTIDVGYDGQVARFEGQIRVIGIQPGLPFSLGGDSGSLIVDMNNLACALLFAGSKDGRFTFASPILSTLQEIEAKIGLSMDIWQFPW